MAGKGSTRERRPSETWWDKQDEPPQALVDGLARAGRILRRVVPSEDADSARARTISAVVLAAVFLVLVWLVVAAVLEHA